MVNVIQGQMEVSLWTSPSCGAHVLATCFPRSSSTRYLYCAVPGELLKIDLITGATVGSVPVGLSPAVSLLAPVGDGDVVAAVRGGREIVWADMGTGETLGCAVGPKKDPSKTITMLTTGPGPVVYYTYQDSKSVYSVDTSSGGAAGSFKPDGAKKPVSAIACHPGKPFVLVGYADGIVKVWETRTDSLKCELTDASQSAGTTKGGGASAPITSIAPHPRRELVALGNGAGRIALWALTNAEAPQYLGSRTLETPTSASPDPIVDVAWILAPTGALAVLHRSGAVNFLKLKETDVTGALSAGALCQHLVPHSALQRWNALEAELAFASRVPEVGANATLRGAAGSGPLVDSSKLSLAGLAVHSALGAITVRSSPASASPRINVYRLLDRKRPASSALPLVAPMAAHPLDHFAGQSGSGPSSTATVPFSSSSSTTTTSAASLSSSALHFAPDVVYLSGNHTVSAHDLASRSEQVVTNLPNTRNGMPLRAMRIARAVTEDGPVVLVVFAVDSVLDRAGSGARDDDPSSSGGARAGDQAAVVGIFFQGDHGDAGTFIDGSDATFTGRDDSTGHMATGAAVLSLKGNEVSLFTLGKRVVEPGPVTTFKGPAIVSIFTVPRAHPALLYAFNDGTLCLSRSAAPVSDTRALSQDLGVAATPAPFPLLKDEIIIAVSWPPAQTSDEEILGILTTKRVAIIESRTMRVLAEALCPAFQPMSFHSLHFVGRALIFTTDTRVKLLTEDGSCSALCGLAEPRSVLAAALPDRLVLVTGLADSPIPVVRALPLAGALIAGEVACLVRASRTASTSSSFTGGGAHKRLIALLEKYSFFSFILLSHCL